MTQKSFKFSVRIDGPGVHPGAWARQRHRLVQPSYDPLAEAREIVEVAERHAIAFAVLDDSYVPRSPAEADSVRYDAVAVAAALGLVTSDIGLVPAVNALLTEPFHVSRAVASIDFISLGRGGWQPQIHAVTAAELRYAGENRFAGVNHSREKRAGEFLEATRQLWHSWEEDAVILDVEAGRFLDTDKVRRINFRGEFFSVAGPSPTPRSPQGTPLTVIAVEDEVSAALAARYADVAVLRAPDAADLAERARTLRELAASAGNERLEIFAAVAIYVDETAQGAQRQRAELDDAGGPLGLSIPQLVGSPADVAGDLAGLLASGSLDGIELALVDSKATIAQWADLLLPALQARGIRPLAGHPHLGHPDLGRQLPAASIQPHAEEKSQ